MKVLITLFLALLAFVSAAEWEVAFPNVMTVAIGVSASSEDVIFVSGGDNGGGAAILKSVDSGATWTTVPRDGQLMYLDIDVSRGSQVSVAGALGFYGQVAVGSYSTTGDSFDALPFDPLFSSSQSVSAVAPDRLYLVGFWLSTLRDDPYDGVMVSTDGGKTLDFFPWTGLTGARYGSFPSNNTWFISGGTWGSSTKRGPDTPLQFSSRVQLVSDSNGGASFKLNEAQVMGTAEGYVGVIQKSVDGGRTFQTVFNETGRLYFNGIDCIDDNTCWVVGEGPDGAWILKTTDGGRNWVEQYAMAAGMSLMDVQFLDANEGWAVGGEFLPNTFNAVFLYTTDGGKTWTNTNSIQNAYPNSITVAASGKAFATAFLRNGLSAILAYR